MGVGEMGLGEMGLGEMGLSQPYMLPTTCFCYLINRQRNIEIGIPDVSSRVRATHAAAECCATRPTDLL